MSPIQLALCLILLALAALVRSPQDPPLDLERARERVMEFERGLHEETDEVRARALREFFSSLAGPEHRLAALEMITSRYVSMVPAAVVPELIEPLLREARLDVRVAAIAGIGRIELGWREPSADFADLVLEIHACCVEEGDVELQEEVLLQMGMLGADEYFVPLKRALRDENARLRTRAAFAYGRWLSLQAGSMSFLCEDPDPDVRRAVLQALGGVAPEFHQERLVEGFEDPEPRVRAAVVHAWASWGHPSIEGFLARALDDESAQVAGPAARALSQLGARDYTANVVRLLEREDVVVVRYALEALSYLGDASHVARVERFLDHEDRQVRERAGEARNRLRAQAGRR